MDSKECVNKIKANFPEKCSLTMINDLVDYIDRINLGPILTEVFYTTIIENYEDRFRYFPTLKQIKTIWEGRHNFGNYESKDFDKYQTRDCVEKTKHYNIHKIIKGVNDIQSGGKCRHEGCQDKHECTTQKLFVKTWIDLASIAGHLVDLNWTESQQDAYLNKIKSEIIAGNKINFDVTTHEKRIDIDLKDDRDHVGHTQRKTRHIGELI